MAHDHGSEFQVKVIHADGTEALSEWIEQENVAQTMAGLRKPQARAYWLRERNVTVAACPLCQDSETAIAEYPFRAAVLALYGTAIERGGDACAEYRAITASGSVVWCRETIRVPSPRAISA